MPSAAASAVLTIPTVLVTPPDRWLVVPAVFVTSFAATLFLGFLGWRGNGPVRRLLNVVKATNKGVEIDSELWLRTTPEEMESFEAVRAIAEGRDPGPRPVRRRRPP